MTVSGLDIRAASPALCDTEKLEAAADLKSTGGENGQNWKKRMGTLSFILYILTDF